MVRRALLFALFLSAGCGARSGLEVDLPDAAPIDAPRPDAQVFDTLRCRWTTSRSIGLTDARGATDVRGVTFHDADLVIASAIPSRAAGLQAFEIIPADPAVLRATHPLVDDGDDRAQLIAWRGGFVEARGDRGACSLTWLDPSFGVLDTQILDPDRGCSIDALSRGGMSVITDPARDGRSFVRVIARDGDGEREDTVLGALPTAPLARPHAARTTDGLTVVHREAGGLAVTIFASGGVLSGDPIRGHVAIESVVGEPLVATDPVRGGAVVLSRTLDGWRIDHVELDGDHIVSFLLSDESVWTATPDPDHVGFVTNESEALVTAGCDTIVVPLAISEPWTIPGPDDCAGILRTILRPDTSFGGQVYLGRDDELRFRALVCNR